MVSVILPVNGDTKDLKDSIQSLRNQIDTSLQVIIVSTSSSQATRNFLNHIVKNDARFSLVKLAKGTPFQKAAEAGARSAEGSYLLFAEPSHFHDVARVKIQVQYLTKYPDAIATYCQSTIHQKNETKTSDFFPFSLMINRAKLPFLFNPYDPRCIRELSSYGTIGMIDRNLLTLQKPSARVTTKPYHFIAAFFAAQKKALNIKKFISGFLPSVRISPGK